MDQEAVQIWLLHRMVVECGSAPADEALRAMRVGTAEAEAVSLAVQERLQAPPDEQTIAQQAGWHALGRIADVLGPASLLTASYRGMPHRLYEFDLPLWPAFRFAWAELPKFHGLVVPKGFRRKLSDPGPRALVPWNVLYEEVVQSRGVPLDEESAASSVDLLRYPDARMMFAFDLLQSVESA